MTTGIPQMPREKSVSQLRDGKLWEAGDVQIGDIETLVGEGLGCESTRKVNFAISSCAATCPTAKACMPPDHHRKFARCSQDSDILNAAKSDSF